MTLYQIFKKWAKEIDYLGHPINWNKDPIDWTINFAHGLFPF